MSDLKTKSEELVSSYRSLEERIQAHINQWTTLFEKHEISGTWRLPEKQCFITVRAGSVLYMRPTYDEEPSPGDVFTPTPGEQLEALLMVRDMALRDSAHAVTIAKERLQTARDAQRQLQRALSLAPSTKTRRPR